MTGHASFVRARAKAIARNRVYMAELKSKMVCAHCGGQPVEWHNPEHVQAGRQRFRIGNMVGRGQAIETIEAEIARCIPLCRRCHMTEDGRLKVLVSHRRVGSTSRPTLVVPLRPCVQCERLYKPLRLGLCASCYGGQPERLARRRELRAMKKKESAS